MKNFEATELSYKNGYEVGRTSVKKENRSIYWALAIKNSITLICFAVLAIVFTKWWIILFSAFFFSYAEVRQHYRICDGCGKRSEHADSYNEALEKAKAAGWIHFVEGNKDYCPECKTKL
jgi:hypothetical protein